MDLLAPLTGKNEKTSESFDSFDPRTGDVVESHPVTSPDEVRAAVQRAKDTSLWWSALSFEERERILGTWKGVITRRIQQLADIVHRETGKPHGDALLEASLAIDHLAWAATHAKKVLRRKRVPSGLLMANTHASVAYKPLGVIGVIGPWNYPVLTPMGSIAYALAAGNTVVFKPSEYTPGVGRWLEKTLNEVCERQILQVVTGLGETGAALCSAGVDKVAFTGSTRTGKRVMAACAETLTPVLIEAGGKDSLIVDEDADVADAADAALWGATSNAGQTCIGVERAYVHERVYQQFVDALVERAKSLRVSEATDSSYGPMTMPSQVEVVRNHIDAALADGGRAATGGQDAMEGGFVKPTILLDVPEESAAVQEETFGPTLTVTKVATMDDAVRRANGTRYGLGNTVFGRANASYIAERLRSGMVSINSVLAFAAVPSLPFGGVGDSGFGRIHGPDGLKEFTYASAIARQRFKPVLPLTSFSRTAKHEQQLAQIMTMRHGRGSTLG